MVKRAPRRNGGRILRKTQKSFRAEKFSPSLPGSTAETLMTPYADAHAVEDQSLGIHVSVGSGVGTTEYQRGAYVVPDPKGTVEPEPRGSVDIEWAERAAAAIILGEDQDRSGGIDSFWALTAEDAIAVRRLFWEDP